MKNKTHLQNIATLTVAVIALSGCDSVKKTFGFDHHKPNEMNVVDNPPLSLPPCYDLRPPEKNGSNTSVSGASEHNKKALEVIAGSHSNQKPSTAKSASTQTLVKEAAKDHSVDKNIKEKINNDQVVDDKKNPLSGVGEKIMNNISNISNDDKDKQK